MLSRHTAALAIALTVGCVSCGGPTGPDLDGPTFVTVRLNGHPWQVTRAVGLVPGTEGVGFTAEHVPTDSGADINSSLSIYIKNLHGAGDYPVTSSSDENQIVLAGVGAYGPIAYQTTPDSPGTVTITDYRTSDSTAAGFFTAHLHAVYPGGSGPAQDIEVKGEFRSRPSTE